jgi:hypothetical protein
VKNRFTSENNTLNIEKTKTTLCRSSNFRSFSRDSSTERFNVQIIAVHKRIWTNLIRISELTLEIEDGEEPFNSELEAAAVL